MSSQFEHPNLLSVQVSDKAPARAIRQIYPRRVIPGFGGP